MGTENSHFGEHKPCESCGRALPRHYEYALCPTCKEAELFREVRDYIRSGTVNEYDVAEHFNIPLRQVKTWIRQGRIEYFSANLSQELVSTHCQMCGAPISFGSLCVKCLKQMNSGKGTAFTPAGSSDVQMHYLDKSKR
jgi:predicted RNA-binding Zn-ribbon protein involved in translation (DUF1610 family)